MNQQHDFARWLKNDAAQHVPRMIVVPVIESVMTIPAAFGLFLLFNHLFGPSIKTDADLWFLFSALLAYAIVVSSIIGVVGTYRRVPDSVVLDEGGMRIKRRIFGEARIEKKEVTDIRIEHAKGLSYGKGIVKIRVRVARADQSSFTVIVLLLSLRLGEDVVKHFKG